MKYVLNFLMVMVLVGCASTPKNDDLELSERNERDYFSVSQNESKLKTQLEHHKKSILSPDKAEIIDWSSIKQGHSYNYNYLFETDKYTTRENRKFIVSKIEGDRYYMDRFSDGKLSKMSFMYQNGRPFIKWLSPEYKSDNNGCDRYKVGECDYSRGSKNWRKVTEYSEGVWSYKKYLNGSVKFVSRAVYDKQGMELYSESLKLDDTGGVKQTVLSERLTEAVKKQSMGYSDFDNLEKVKEAHKLAKLEKVYLFPLELGGKEADINILYLPKKAADMKAEIDRNILNLANEGKIKNYTANPIYDTKSFIPNKIKIETMGSSGETYTVHIF